MSARNVANMSTPNVANFRDWLDAFDRRDKAAYLAARHPETEVVTVGDWPEQNVIRGAEAAWDFYIDILDTLRMEGLSAEAELFPAGDDKVVAYHHQAARGSASGAEVEMEYWVVVTFRDGKAWRDEWFRDRNSAFAAAGLPADGP